MPDEPAQPRGPEPARDPAQCHRRYVPMPMRVDSAVAPANRLLRAGFANHLADTANNRRKLDTTAMTCSTCLIDIASAVVPDSQGRRARLAATVRGGGAVTLGYRASRVVARLPSAPYVGDYLGHASGVVRRCALVRSGLSRLCGVIYH
jgi:hypothetical protein